MPKLEFNQNVIDDTIIPNLNSAVSNLEALVRKNSSMVIPIDFSYRSSMNGYSEAIISSKNKISNLIKWFDDSKNIFTSLIDSMNVSINSIKNEDIKERKAIF